jgi:fumarylacetoacetase
MLNETHNPDALSWVPSANAPDTDFPLQNLPFGVFARPSEDDRPRVGVAIGNQILDIAGCHTRGLFDGRAAAAAEACMSPPLNALMALGRPAWSALRARVSELLRAYHPDQRHLRSLVEPCLVSMAEVTLRMPVVVGNYSDFYASIHHATNVGSMMRPDSPLLPNYKYVPIGYHGRASSLIVSGTPVRRPQGQVKRGEEPPVYRPTERLDFEAELGLFVGPGNSLGDPIPIDRTDDHMFGVCLVNDWSARDIQQWEYQPLGPFLAKSFATSLSPWIVTIEALEPFRMPVPARPEGDPAPLPYLDSERHRQAGAIDLTIETWLVTAEMRAAGLEAVRLSRSTMLHMYWTPAQLLVHHASNGCSLQPGDLLASGTVSGPTPDSRACLLELAWRGTEPLRLPSGEHRRFLEDGDEVILKGYAVRPGTTRIGLGECRGVVQGW